MITQRGWYAPLLRPTNTKDDSLRLKLHDHSSLKWSRCHKASTVLINFERMSTASLQHTSYSLKDEVDYHAGQCSFVVKMLTTM